MALPPVRRIAAAAFAGFVLAFLTGIVAFPDPTGVLPIVWTAVAGPLLTVGVLGGGVDRIGRFAAVFCGLLIAGMILLGAAHVGLSAVGLGIPTVIAGWVNVASVALMLVVGVAAYVQVYRREAAPE